MEVAARGKWSPEEQRSQCLMATDSVLQDEGLCGWMMVLVM